MRDDFISCREKVVHVDLRGRGPRVGNQKEFVKPWSGRALGENLSSAALVTPAAACPASKAAPAPSRYIARSMKIG